MFSIDDDIIKNILKIDRKIALYGKKKETMGLDENEEKKYLNLITQHYKIADEVNDKVFNKHVFEKIRDAVIDFMIIEIRDRIGWSGEIIVDIDDICDRIDELSINEKNEVLNIIEELEKAIIYKTEDLYYNASNEDIEILDLVGDVVSNGEAPNILGIIDFIKYKFKLIYICFC